MGLGVHFTLQQCPIRGVGNFSYLFIIYVDSLNFSHTYS